MADLLEELNWPLDCAQLQYAISDRRERLSYYRQPERLADLSLKVKKRNEASWCLLPLDHSVEMAAFEARDQMLIFNPCHFQVKGSLKALELLKEAGEKVIFNITGPVTLFDHKLGPAASRRLLKQQGKDQRFLALVFRGYKDWLQILSQSGVDLVSYADPTGGLEILGARWFSRSGGCWNRDILLAADKEWKGKNQLISIHPSLGKALLETGFVQVTGSLPVPADKMDILFDIDTQGLSFVTRQSEDELLCIAFD